MLLQKLGHIFSGINNTLMYVRDFIHNVLSDPKTESGLPLPHLNIYVPQDERFGHLKLSDFLAYALKSACNALVPILNALFDKTPTEFDSFQDVLSLYKEGIRLLDFEVIEEIKDRTPFELIKEFATTDGDIFSSCRCHKLPQKTHFLGELMKNLDEKCLLESTL